MLLRHSRRLALCLHRRMRHSRSTLIPRDLQHHLPRLEITRRPKYRVWGALPERVCVYGVQRVPLQRLAVGDPRGERRVRCGGRIGAGPTGARLGQSSHSHLPEPRLTDCDQSLRARSVLGAGVLGLLECYPCLGHSVPTARYVGRVRRLFAVSVHLLLLLERSVPMSRPCRPVRSLTYPPSAPLPNL